MAAATGLTSESVRDAVARIAPIVEQHRDDGEKNRRLADPVVKAIRDAGLFASLTAREYGGSEIDLSVFMAAVEGLARVDAAAGWVFGNLACGGVLAAHLPDAGARQIYATGPNIPLPGAVAPKGRATPVDGGYRLSGRWPLGSGCHFGDWLSGVSLVFDGDAPRMGPAGPDLRVMFFKPEAAQILDTWDSVGLRGTGSNDFAVNDAFVPEELCFPLFGPPQAAGPLYRIGILPLYSMALTTVLLGIARAAIDSFVALAREKTPTLSQSGLANRPTIHAEVAKAEASLQSARAFLYTVADELTAAVTNGGAVPDEIEARRRLACVNIGAVCPTVVSSVYGLAGATPIYSGHRLERCLRDAQTASQHLVVSPVWWEKTGQYYFGLGLGMP